MHYVVQKLTHLVTQCDQAIEGISSLAELLFGSFDLTAAAIVTVSENIYITRGGWYTFLGGNSGYMFTLRRQKEALTGLANLLSEGNIQVGRTSQNLRSMRAQLQELLQRFSRQSDDDDKFIVALHLHAIDSSVTRLLEETDRNAPIATAAIMADARVTTSEANRGGHEGDMVGGGMREAL